MGVRTGADGKLRPAGAGAGAAAVSILLLGCLARAPMHGEAEPRIVWPPPPAEPRIEYLRSFREPGDLGIRKNWFVRFFRYLGRGRQPALMVRPFGVAVAPDGRIAVSDPDGRSVHLFDPAGSDFRRLSEAGGEPFQSPVGTAFDEEGRLYVSDSVRRRVFRFDSKGRWLDSLGGEKELRRPTGLALDRGEGLLYVVDTLGHRVVVYRLDGSRALEFGGRGTGDGEFNYPVAIARDGSGRLLVTDSMNFRVQILDSSGAFLGEFGRAGDGPGDFDKAKGIAVDARGRIYVVEALHDVVHVYDPEGRLLAVIGGTGNGPGQFWLPAGIHIDQQGRIWIADSANHRIQVLQILDDAGGGESD